MSALEKLFGDFQKAIIDNDAALAAGDVKPNPRMTAEKQLAIYMDGYRIRLVQAIGSDYPALTALLGEKEFERLARDYVEQHPSQHFNLDRYPYGFAAFVTSRVDTFAAELAMLEAVIAQVFMMEESAPCDASTLMNLTPDAFGAARLQRRAASALLAFSYPVNAWLSAQREGKNPPCPAPQATFLYLYRHRNHVQRVELDEPEFLLLQAMAAEKPIGAVLDAVIAAHPHHAKVVAANIQQWFARWLSQGFFRG